MAMITRTAGIPTALHHKPAMSGGLLEVEMSAWTQSTHAASHGLLRREDCVEDAEIVAAMSLQRLD